MTTHVLVRPDRARPEGAGTLTGTGHPDIGEGSTAGGADQAASVVVTGVGPVFGRGLTDALRAAGVAAALVREPAAAAAAGDRLGARLVVAALPCFARVHHDVREAGSRARTAVLVEGDGPEDYRRGMAAGAHAVVPVTASPAVMVAVLAAAVRGYRLVPADAAGALCRAVVSTSAVEVPEHELGCLRAIAAGMTVAGLARRSGCSERETYRQLAGAYRRLGAANRTEALIAAQRAGLLDPEHR